MPATEAQNLKAGAPIDWPLPGLAELEMQLAAGRDPDAPFGPQGQLPLAQACLQDLAGHARLLLLAGADPAKPDADGCCALHHAAACPDPAALAQILPAFPGCPDVPDPQGFTPLHVACENDLWDNICALARAGADPLAANRLGQNAFDICRGLRPGLACDLSGLCDSLACLAALGACRPRNPKPRNRAPKGI